MQAADELSGERDLLTGLYSSGAARSRLADHIAAGIAGDRGKAPFALMLVGLRRFQAVNMAFGQEQGDLVLAETARRIAFFAGEELDGDWFAARLGGRDFLVASLSPVAPERWQWLAEQLADVISRPMALSEEKARLTARIALLASQGDEPLDQVLDRLSSAAARAHGQSAGRTAWADAQVTTGPRSAAELEGDLLRAIDRDEIAVALQPQFRVMDGTLVGAESLARWDHGAIGRIGASTLFAVAERCDFTEHLSAHVNERALAAAAQWPAALGPLRLSLNITAAEMASGQFAATLLRAVDASGFEPARLTVEVTEQALIGDLTQAHGSLSELAAQGIGVAIDDFGTGYANFQYLTSLPVSVLKLDTLMVRDIAASPRDRIVARSIIAMARALGLTTVAEGVETDRQLALLREEGCDIYQGFLRSGPLAPADFVRLATG